MIVSGYIMSTKLVDNVETIIQPFAILFLTVIGSYFFFRSTVSLIFKAIQRLRNGTVSVTMLCSHHLLYIVLRRMHFL